MAVKGTDNGYGVIHEAGSADFNNFVYFRIYAGANAAPVINGTSVTMAASSTLDVYVISISGTLTNVYLIGEPKNVADGPITLSRYPEPT
tara:strand:- start:569 stop:838 length:270 start_codon:yes stop_codon:yes gene_type:complete